MNVKLAKKRYTEQKGQAKKRCIDWLFTFESWCDIWLESEKWDQRGRGKGKYVMARKGDIGPYSADNVDIITHGANISEGNKGIPKSDATKAKMSDIKIGKSFSEDHKLNMSVARKLFLSRNCKKGENYV
jgi:hypothetical protein